MLEEVGVCRFSNGLVQDEVGFEHWEFNDQNSEGG